MRWYTVDYLNDRGPRPGRHIDRGFWLFQTPRLVLWCRLFGHRPVVDGTPETRPGHPGQRWVCCDRCGVRPDTQGRLDPAAYHIGEPYTGPWGAGLPKDPRLRREVIADLKGVYYPPGPWPKRPTGEVGGQVIIGRIFGGVGADIKIGNSGSEQVLSASFRLNPLGALYLHTDRHGQWLQRRLNPTGYESRVIEVGVDNNRLRWRFWAKRDGSDPGTPRWRDGSTVINPIERWFGPVMADFEDDGTPVKVTVRMPHGDDHVASVQLQRVRTGRRRGRKIESWSAQWTCRSGIPTNHGWNGSIIGSTVDLSDAAVEQDTWPAEAAAAIAADMTRERIRRGFRPSSDAEDAHTS